MSGEVFRSAENIFHVFWEITRFSPCRVSQAEYNARPRFGGNPGKSGGGDALMSIPREERRAFLRSTASAELFNKKIKTDVWALGVGIGITTIQTLSDSLIHVIFDSRCLSRVL